MIDLENLRRWFGSSESVDDVLTAAPLSALASMLDRNEPPPRAGDPVPAGAHWLYFLPLDRQSNLAEDGHAKRGGFLPPVPLPLRMWAASDIEFRRTLRVGASISRRSSVTDVTLKQGRTGPLVFVRVTHEVSDEGGIAIVEIQDLVYREAPRTDAHKVGTAAARAPDWSREIVPDAVLLFRFSALTFNGHRIHYDRRYAVEVEGYPGLVVHGPLLATLLLDLLRRHNPQARVARFGFKAVKPVFDTAPFLLCGRHEGANVVLWVNDPQGDLAMEAVAVLA